MLEVLHLYSGHPLTRFEMSPESLYLDVNNDGVVDRVDAVPEKAQRGKKRRSKSGKDTCLATASSGVPAIETLFEVSVCESVYLGLFGLGFGFSFDQIYSNKGEDVDMANPTYIDTLDGRFHTVFLVSTGRVTAINPEGAVVWQRDTQATWSRVGNNKKAHRRSARFGRVDSFLEMGGFPSISPFSLYGQNVSFSLLPVLRTWLTLS